MPIRKILVPYDGSKSSEKALREVITLAQDLQANVELVLLNVVQEVMVPAVMLESPFRSSITGEQITSTQMAKELRQQLKKSASKMLEDKKQKLKDDHVSYLHITTKVLLGQPIEKVIEYADEEKVDMIAIGSVGLSGFSRLKALGSVSRGIVERAKCPVLVVH
jgi:nucleotide-binding universal stress UspA family protein